ncbi:MAG: site-2 protease family protein, partial [Verrucomicrobiota bacterium]
MVFDILKFVFICLEVVLIFNLLIVVHELGHFLAAKWRGLVVEKFAIWFGKPIWKKTIGGVEYRLGSIPAGGFVAIPQLAPMEALEGKVEQSRDDLPPVKPLDKIIVAAAGPLFSFGLAFVMACIVWSVGKPQSEFDSPTIGYVKDGGPADKAGIRVGDVIVAVDGQPVK